MDKKAEVGGNGGGGKQGKGPKPAPAAPTNFIRNIIAADLARGTYEPRQWGGKPGIYDLHARAPPTRRRSAPAFPPEPNGYLHIGHAKSICLNFGLARDFGGVLPHALRRHQPGQGRPGVRRRHPRHGALARLRLGARFGIEPVPRLDYFDFMYRFAEHLIETGYAYVDEQSADADARNARHADRARHQLAVPRPADRGEPAPVPRDARRPHADGSMILRAKIDMGSPNINMRDPAIYRIRFAEHHMTGDAWCIYPMYAYAHPIEDALENITHSICTLEFEDQRPFYDWVLERIVPLLRKPQFEAAKAKLDEIRTAASKRSASSRCIAETWLRKDPTSSVPAATSAAQKRCSPAGAGTRTWPPATPTSSSSCCAEHTECFTPLLQHALDDFATGGKPNPFMLPHQHEFNRLNLTYVVMSKRKLIQLVQDGHVDGWDDPRMPTLVGLRRRGYTPQAIQLFMERIGVSKSTQWIDYAVLEQALRDDLDARAPRATAVLRPTETHPRQLPGRPDGRARDAARAPAAPRNGHAHDPVRTRAVDRGRRLHGERAGRLLPPRAGQGRGAGQPRAAALRLRDPRDERGEGRRRPHHRRARRVPAGNQERLARPEQRQDQDGDPLAAGGGEHPRRSARVRPPVHRPAARRRREATSSTC
jgi:glutaminyl-tRNA synthetase